MFFRNPCQKTWTVKHDVFFQKNNIFSAKTDVFYGQRRAKHNLLFYSQSSQTPLTDCFTLTGSSEGNLNNIQHCKNYYYIVNVTQKLNFFKYSYSKTMGFNYGH